MDDKELKENCIKDARTILGSGYEIDFYWQELGKYFFDWYKLGFDEGKNERNIKLQK